MYIPASFSENNQAAIAELIAAHPLGLLVTSGQSGLMASPIPFVYREEEGGLFLIAHLAKANPHWKELESTDECLVVFQGAEGYVTPDWYPSKKSTHKTVPTWNYQVVQVKGKPTVIHDLAWLMSLVESVTDFMEHKRSTPWKPSDAPADFIESQLKAIVGLKIGVTEIKGKWKMSQNRTQEDAAGVVAGMSDPKDPHFNPEVAEIVTARCHAK
jgi:transcriptional regulator